MLGTACAAAVSSTSACPAEAMDDTLEEPAQIQNLQYERQDSTRAHDDEEQSSGDEDGGLDWTKLPYVSTFSPSRRSVRYH